MKLNLKSGEEVRQAFRDIRKSVSEKATAADFLGVTVQRMIKPEGYEIILGSSIDPQFGPVLLFGSGGQLVEVFKDRALGLPPLNTTLARLMMEQTKIYTALKGVRGRKPVDLHALEELVVRFSYLVSEHGWIREIDINPLIVSPDGMLALDARVILHDPATKPEAFPRLAIRPYPSNYVTAVTLENGTPVTIRPILPEDEPLLVAFHGTLSETTVRQRYLENLPLETRIAHQRLTRICFSDYNREITLVANHRRDDGTHEIIGVGRLNKMHGLDEATFAVVVSDAWQGKGLGTELLKLLLQAGRDEKVKRLSGAMLADNDRMRRICASAGFQLSFDEQTQDWKAEVIL